MSNVTNQLLDRINARLQETKNPCKSYITEAAAERALETVAAHVALHFGIPTKDVNYIVFYVPAMGRWTGAIDINGVVRHPKSHGGYLGVAADFYTY